MGEHRVMQRVVWLLAWMLSVAGLGAQTNVALLDIFGRSLNERGITLVDWEGFIANPAIAVAVRPPANAAFPATAILRANSERVYFDRPSQNSANGALKTISFANAASSITVLFSIFPDRDGIDESYTLRIEFAGNNGARFTNSFPIFVVDHDKSLTNVFNVTIDFSQDKTGFFGDPQTRAVAVQAANELAYFVGNTNLNLVPAQTENTWIWETNGFVSGRYILNSSAYRGYLLYAYGIHSTALRSGGEGSYGGGFQMSGSTQLPLRRSGGFEAETAGNYNSLGWLVSTNEQDWWVTGNLGNERNDLASIAHHEIGHALFFNSAYPQFSQAKSDGFIVSSNILAYFGRSIPIDASEHFNGSVDPASRKGAFGYEYYGDMPIRRWLWTKLDLLCAEAMGYQLRDTTPIKALGITTTNVAEAFEGIPYSQMIGATGGVPVYAWDITSGALPAGLSLDGFTGIVSGTPTQTNSSVATVRLRDHVEGTPGITRAFTFHVRPAPSFAFDPVATILTNSDFRGRILGTAGQAQVVEYSENLVNWIPLTTNRAGTNVFNFADTNAAVTGQERFYRGRAP